MQPSKKCKSKSKKQQREGIWANEQILVAGENHHQAGKDLPLQYGVFTCRFWANWQRAPAYGIGSPLPACFVFFIIPSCILFPLFALPYSPTDCLVNHFLKACVTIVAFLFLAPSFSCLSSTFSCVQILLFVSERGWHHKKNLNNHLSTITAQLRQAEMAMIFFPLVTWLSFAPTRKKICKKKGTNGLD